MERDGDNQSSEMERDEYVTSLTDTASYVALAKSLDIK